ncbi:MAG: DUF1080 domain-containing protein [Myxococcales bacterium]
MRSHRSKAKRAVVGPGVLAASLLVACAHLQAGCDHADSDPTCQAPPQTFGSAVALFDGQTLTGWSGDPRVWRVERGEIVASSGAARVARNTFLISSRTFSDFVLTADVLLVNDQGNSGLQFRSTVVDPLAWSVAGYQADVSKDGWGLLYEEALGRGALQYPNAACQSAARSNDWNHYEIIASGCSIKLSVNGTLCTEFGEGDPQRARSGVVALQYHAPGGFEVHFRNVRIAEPQ